MGLDVHIFTTSKTSAAKLPLNDTGKDSDLTGIYSRPQRMKYKGFPIKELFYARNDWALLDALGLNRGSLPPVSRLLGADCKSLKVGNMMREALKQGKGVFIYCSY